MTSPTQRTLNYLRRNGWQAAIVEKRIQIPGSPHGKLTDVWGFGDVLACRPGEIALIQTTSGAGANYRRRKLLGKLTEADLTECDEKERKRLAAIPVALRKWLKAGGVVMLISWSKMGARGKRKLWTERVETIQLGEG